MILNCHQPNFLPYLGFFYKMYKCDVYSVSDTCSFSSSDGFHNYNFINEFGNKKKITLPISKHSGRLCDIEIAPEWERYKIKLLKRIYYSYCKCLHFKEVWNDIETLFQNIKPGQKLTDVNLTFITMICKKMGIEKPFYFESFEKDLPNTPDEAIIYMCKKTGCNEYIVGIHGNQYMNLEKYEKEKIKLVYSDFDNAKDLTGNHLSILDYLMNYGYYIPKEWN